MQIYQIISLFIPLAGIAASYLILKKAVHWLMVLLVLFLLMPYIIAMLLLWGFPYSSMIVNVVRASNWLFFCVAYTGILTNWINQQPKKSNNDNPIMGRGIVTTFDYKFSEVFFTILNSRIINNQSIHLSCFHFFNQQS